MYHSLIYDIASMAYVIADIRADTMTPHQLHQTFDICQPGNLDRVNNLLKLAFAEVITILKPLLKHPHHRCKDQEFKGSQSKDQEFKLQFHHRVDTATRHLVNETVREFLTARVLADWLAVTLPEAAPFWRDKSEGHATSLRQLSLNSFNRCLPPL